MEDNNKHIWDLIDENINNKKNYNGRNNPSEVFLVNKTKKDYLRELNVRFPNEISNDMDIT